MTEYSYVYLALAVILLLYSVFHRLDLLCVASVCFIVYSIYCISGYGISGYYRPRLSPSLYHAVYTQMTIIFFFIAYSRYQMKRERLRQPAPEPEAVPAGESRVLRISFRIYTAIIVLFALMNIASVGLRGFMAGKASVWEQTNVLFIVSLYGAWPAFAYGIHKNDKRVWVPSLLVELTIFFAGSRAFAASIIVIFLCEKGTVLWQNRKSFMKIYILGALGVVFLLMYRMVDQQIMVGDLSGAIRTLKNPSVWLEALEFNEPRVIIANYDYAFTSGMHFPFGDTIYRIIDFVPGLTSIFDIHLEYPEYYSMWLMNQVHGSAGVGGSIWGESFAMMGHVGIFGLTLIWLWFVRLCNRHLDYHASYSYFLVSIGTYYAWYINRLDFNRIAQAAKVMLLCFLIWAFVYVFLGGVLKIGNTRIRLKSAPAK